MTTAQAAILLVLCIALVASGAVALAGIAERRRHLEELHERRDALADTGAHVEHNELPRVLGRMGPGGYIERRAEPRAVDYEAVRDDWAHREALRRIAAAEDAETRERLTEELLCHQA